MTALPTNLFLAPDVATRAPAHVRHAKLIGWVAEMAALTGAKDVSWCDGSDAEYRALTTPRAFKQLQREPPRHVCL